MNAKNVYDKTVTYLSKYSPTYKIVEMFEYGNGMYLFTYSDNGKVGYSDPYIIADETHNPLQYAPMDDMDNFIRALNNPIDISKF